MLLTDYLQAIDERLFQVLHERHLPWLDRVMWSVSQMKIWIPVYGIMLVSIYRKLKPVVFVATIIALALLLFLTDFVAVHLVKETVQRLRPSHHPGLQHIVHLVMDDHGLPYRGGRYGFFSNHASNYAGVVMFFYLVMRPMKRYAIALLFTWVLLISYSRIYLGVHYPLDILAGWIYGATCGWLVYRLLKRLTQFEQVP